MKKFLSSLTKNKSSKKDVAPPHPNDHPNDHPILPSHIEITKRAFEDACIFPLHVWESIISFSSVGSLFNLSLTCSTFYHYAKKYMEPDADLINGYWAFLVSVNNNNYFGSGNLELLPNNIIIGRGMAPYSASVSDYSSFGIKKLNTIVMSTIFLKRSTGTFSVAIMKLMYDKASKEYILNGSSCALAGSVLTVPTIAMRYGKVQKDRVTMLKLIRKSYPRAERWVKTQMVEEKAEDISDQQEEDCKSDEAVHNVLKNVKPITQINNGVLKGSFKFVFTFDTLRIEVVAIMIHNEFVSVGSIKHILHEDKKMSDEEDKNEKKEDDKKEPAFVDPNVTILVSVDHEGVIGIIFSYLRHQDDTEGVNICGLAYFTSKQYSFAGEVAYYQSPPLKGTVVGEREECKT